MNQRRSAEESAALGKLADPMTNADRFDYSTIDVDRLRQHTTLTDWLKQNKRARGHMRPHDGTSSYDRFPPGHPIHFTQQVQHYTGTIDDLLVIADPNNRALVYPHYDKENRYQQRFEEGALLRYYVVGQLGWKALWRPLPLEHPRVQIWMYDIFLDYGREFLEHDHKTFFSYPPFPRSSVHEPKIDPHWKESYIAQVRAQYHLDYTAEQAEIEMHARRYATFERNRAVSLVRKFFPQYSDPALFDAARANTLSQRSELHELTPRRWHPLYASKFAQARDAVFQWLH